MKKILSWWYIPLVFIGVIFILYAGLIGYRLMAADDNSQPSGDENPGFWNNITESLGINTRRLQGEHEGRVNFLLVGVPGTYENAAPDLTDTIMLASIDVKNHKINLISVPRDLYVLVPGFGYNKINAAYSLGKNFDVAGGGMDVLKDTVYDVLGQKIDYYVKVDFDGFVEAIDTLGGVDVVVENDIYDYLYPDENHGYQVFALDAGKQHLDGKTALKYVRSRETTSDFDRARRQQQVIVASREAFLSKGVVEGAKILVKLLDIVSQHVETDMKIWEIERVVKIARDWGDDFTVSSVVLDNATTGLLHDDSVDGMYILRPIGGDYSAIQDYVDEILAEKSGEPAKKITFEVYNATNRVGLAGAAADVLEEENQLVTVIENAEENAEESYMICQKNDNYKDAVKFIQELWGITKVSQAELDEADCQIYLGNDFSLEKEEN